MYSVGTKVVYPIHGIGEIKGIEEQLILGQTRKYYVLELLNSSMKVMLPCDCNDNYKVRLRTIAGKKEIIKAVSILENEQNNITLSDNWRERYTYNSDKLKEGSFLGIAEVISNLSSRKNCNSISNSEKKLLRNAMNLISDEIAFATSQSKSKVENMLNNILTKTKTDDDTKNEILKMINNKDL